MGRPRIQKTPREIICQILAANVTAKLPRVFPAAKNETDQFAALAKRIGVAPETVRRAMKGHTAPRLDIVDKIARGLGTTTAELLQPSDQAASADHPPKGGNALTTPSRAAPY